MNIAGSLENTPHYTKLDAWLALALAVVILILSVLCMEPNAPWGDDSDGYILEAISIAEGRLPQQAEIIAYIHPSTAPPEAIGQAKVYAWGYPLLLAPIYSIFGYDCVSYSTVIYYAIPTVIAYGVFAVAFYLLLRRRCGYLASGFASLSYCLCTPIFQMQNWLYGDIIFMSLTVLTLLLAEMFYERLYGRGFRGKADAPMIVLAVCLGVLMFYACSIRINGINTCCTVLLIHAVNLIPARSSWKDTRQHILGFSPYVLAFALMQLFNKAIFMPPTSNLMNDFLRITLDVLKYNLSDMISIFQTFVGRLFPSSVMFVSLTVFCILALLGFARQWWRNLPFVALTGVTLVGILLVPYNQWLRYYLPVFPLLLIFAAMGAEYLITLLMQWNRWVKAALWVLIGLFIATNTVAAARNLPDFTLPAVLNGSYQPEAGAQFSSDAIDMYHYIQRTPEDSVIMFAKPRALYLNTERLSFAPGTSQHDSDEADYFLTAPGVPEDTGPYSADQLTLLYENGEFKFYEVDTSLKS